MDTVTHLANDLSTSDRTAIEHLLGKPLQSDERVVIIRYNPTEADTNVRTAARARLEAALNRAANHAASAGISEVEADAAVAEAMEAIRPRL